MKLKMCFNELRFSPELKKGVNAPFSSGVYPFFENKKCDLLSS